MKYQINRNSYHAALVQAVKEGMVLSVRISNVVINLQI